MGGGGGGGERGGGEEGAGRGGGERASAWKGIIKDRTQVVQVRSGPCVSNLHKILANDLFPKLTSLAMSAFCHEANGSTKTYRKRQ